jgi:hypothetical protein
MAAIWNGLGQSLGILPQDLEAFFLVWLLNVAQRSQAPSHSAQGLEITNLPAGSASHEISLHFTS